MSAIAKYIPNLASKILGADNIAADIITIAPPQPPHDIGQDVPWRTYPTGMETGHPWRKYVQSTCNDYYATIQPFSQLVDVPAKGGCAALVLIIAVAFTGIMEACPFVLPQNWTSVTNHDFIPFSRVDAITVLRWVADHPAAAAVLTYSESDDTLSASCRLAADAFEASVSTDPSVWSYRPTSQYIDIGRVAYFIGATLRQHVQVDMICCTESGARDSERITYPVFTDTFDVSAGTLTGIRLCYMMGPLDSCTGHAAIIAVSGGHEPLA